MSKRLLAYGTLRAGDYNFDRMKSHFGSDSIKKLGEVVVPKFKMYNLGFYPAIVKSELENDTIKCDILEVSEQAFNAIESMEHGAGYQTETVSLDEQTYSIYVQTREISEERRISSGDWFNK